MKITKGRGDGGRHRESLAALLDDPPDPPGEPGEPFRYGGRLVFSNGNGCLVCFRELDTAEAQLDLAGAAARAE